VELPLPADADKELLTAARSAAEYCAEGHHELMTKAIAGEYTPPGWTGVEGEPDAHEYDEARWLQADARLDVINEALDHIDGRDLATQQANDESTKRQEAERLERSGEAAAAPSLDVSSHLAAKLESSAAEAERESQEMALQDHGDGKAPGGGGRRIF
jgi:hypothetical protein